MFFETLENRAMFSVSLVHGLLTVTGTNLADTIIISKNNGGGLTVNDDGSIHNYGWNSVSQVNVNALGGNDLVESFNSMTKPMVIHGGDGNDTLLGGGGNDTIYGDNGNDLIDGRMGNDDMYGGAGIDTVDYSDRNYNLRITLDNIANDGGPGGHDNVHSDIENVLGGSGNDYIAGNSADNLLIGNGGNDTIYGGGGNDTLEGGNGNDYLSLGAGNGTITGDNGNDTLVGGTGSGANFLYGGAGDDTIYGEGNTNYLHGGDGNDYINSYASGITWAYGEAGDDTLVGGFGQNVLYGGDGNDTLIGYGYQTNWIYGDAGNDTITGGSAQNVLYGGDGNDTIHGNGSSTNWIYGEAGDDKLYGGTSGYSYIYGGDGNDQLFAGTGPSLLDGGAGDDTLVSVGGSQYDTLTGGDGFDSFWCDAETTEQVTDANLFESLLGAVHRVSGFYGGVSRDRAGQTFTEPNATNSRSSNYSPNWKSFSDHVLFASTGPGENDIVQGQAGDCYFLAGLSGTAKDNQVRIRQTVVDLGDGTYAVDFKSGSSDTFIRVDGELPVWQGSSSLYYASTGAQGCIWVPILEKAFTYFRSNAGTYDSIWYGSSQEEFRALGGTSVGTLWGTSASDTLDQINAALASGKQVCAWTPGGTPTNGCPCIAGHEYTVDHVNYQMIYIPYYGWLNVAVSITLRNPWGFDGAGSDSNPSDGYVTATADQFYGYFGGAETAFV